MKSKKNAIVVNFIVFISLLGSIFLAIIAFQDIPKYNKPYLFTLIVAVVGVLVGYLLWKKIKTFITKHRAKNNDDGTMIGLLIMTVIGVLLFTVNEFNILSANKKYCDSFHIENKYREEGGFRRPEVNTLVVAINDKKETVVCNLELWTDKSIGENIKLCVYESVLGFNYTELNE
tara:strand:+ start:137 stop:661 length:525 start_codon:yes stop_codon:yes gene_type:complete